MKQRGEINKIINEQAKVNSLDDWGEKKSMKLYNLCLDDKDNKQEITICQQGGWGRGGTTELQILELKDIL